MRIRTLAVLFAFFISASACENAIVNHLEEGPNDGGGNGSVKEYSIVGVWESGKYFLSFSDDGFFSAYYTQKRIESGSFIRSGNTITITCPFFGTTTKVTVRYIDDGTMVVQIDYKDHISGTFEVQQLTLAKSTKTPSVKSHDLIGKTYSSEVAGQGIVSYAFTTGDAIKKTSDKSGIEPYPLTLFYVYLDGTIYYQTFVQTGSNPPSINGWNTIAGSFSIKAEMVTISSSGVIERIEDVTGLKI